MLMNFELDKCRHIIIFGAGHGIGFALVQYLHQNYPRIQVFATYRKKEKAQELIELSAIESQSIKVFQISPTEETQVADLAQKLKDEKIKFDCIINTIGILHTEDVKPEKSIKDFDPKSFLEVISVNTIITALIGKHFQNLLISNGPSAFVALSAKIGSIGDNRLGGWHSYRASKAALNMILKNISLEFEKKRLKCLVLPIHPGTTHTELSAPYAKNTSYQVHSPLRTAENILDVINNRSIQDTGHFYSWDKQEIDW
jgi:NAD(P)-dependent dehydrogenase (short-subunit alcohol dehydrogenase family)